MSPRVDAKDHISLLECHSMLDQIYKEAKASKKNPKTAIVVAMRKLFYQGYEAGSTNRLHHLKRQMRKASDAELLTLAREKFVHDSLEKMQRKMARVLLNFLTETKIK